MHSHHNSQLLSTRQTGHALACVYERDADARPSSLQADCRDLRRDRYHPATAPAGWPDGAEPCGANQSAAKDPAERAAHL
eukprot:303163-Prymnesium_polylepis.2